MRQTFRKGARVAIAIVRILAFHAKIQGRLAQLTAQIAGLVDDVLPATEVRAGGDGFASCARGEVECIPHVVHSGRVQEVAPRGGKE